ncbi:MAG: flagellar basal body P-ring protein FlgI [Deltaproteobacteria bacterium]|jgi:flagellar P-ring protein precursor FlgI|nr:flagellar basal body P-ring protein FlgI [Deltaproteobacteria bacterium]
MKPRDLIGAFLEWLGRLVRPAEPALVPVPDDRSRRAAARAVALALPIVTLAATSHAARIRDIADLRGVRANDLIGYGLIVGLDGTGDDMGLTRQSLASFLDRLGVTLDEAEVKKMKPENVAAVSVTAVLPPFASPGGRIDVLVSSIGDAKTLQGGTLLMTPLRGADGHVYAVAQGPISLGGFSASSKGGGDSAQKNQKAVGRVPAGARVERAVEVSFDASHELSYALREPSFTTAQRMAEAINQELGATAAVAADAGTVKVSVPESMGQEGVALAARIEGVSVEPDRPARVVINERTGTVVMGADVRLAKIALAHGGLTIEVNQTLGVSQPAPFSENGRTVVVPNSDVKVREETRQLSVVEPGATISDLVRALNGLAVSPRDLIAILQAIRQAGAMDADLEII